MQKKVKEDFHQKVHQNTRTYPNMSKLQLLCDSNQLDIADQSLVLEILSKGDKLIKQEINNNIDGFITILLEAKNIKGSKWDDIIIRFEWTLEE